MDERLDIGKAIRELRRKRNLTGEELAKKAAISQPKLSKIETGALASPRREDLMRLLDILDAPQTIRQHLSDRSDEIFQLHPFDYHYPFEQTLARESKATHIRVLGMALIPALLQTHDYRDALYRHTRLSDRDAKLLMKANSTRQDMLWDKHRRYHFIIPEQTLYTRLGDNNLQLAQLDRIDRFISTRQHIKVGILPYQAGFVPHDVCAFTLCDTTSIGMATASGDIESTDEEVIRLHLKTFEASDKLADYGDTAHVLVHKAMDYFG